MSSLLSLVRILIAVAGASVEEAKNSTPLLAK